MLDENLGSWSFPIFFEYWISQGTIFLQLIKHLLYIYIYNIYIYIYLLYIYIYIRF